MTTQKKYVSGMKHIGLALLVLAAPVLGTGCKGNSSSSSGSSIQSSAFGSSVSRVAEVTDEWGNTMMVEIQNLNPVLATVNGLSFCVTQLKLEAEGEAGDLMEAPLGLINVGDGSQVINWGDADIPNGTSLKKLHVEVHRDPEICGVNYSVQFNGMELQQDVEMTFTFASSITVSDSVITVDLAPIAQAFIDASNASSFSDGLINSYIETIEGSAE